MTINFNLISFALAIVSIVLAGISLWLSKSYRDESISLNKHSEYALAEIKMHAIIISKYAIPELKAYGESLREYLFKTQKGSALSVIEKGIPTIPTSTAKHIRQDLLTEVGFLRKNTGRALSMDLFERLKHKYDFSTILSELLIMAKDNQLKWAEAPNPPEALSEITFVQEEQA